MTPKSATARPRQGTSPRQSDLSASCVRGGSFSSNDRLARGGPSSWRSFPMIATVKPFSKQKAAPKWHATFTTRILPAVKRHAALAFRHLGPEARAEAIAEVVAAATEAYVRLVRRQWCHCKRSTCLAEIARTTRRWGRPRPHLRPLSIQPAPQPARSTTDALKVDQRQVHFPGSMGMTGRPGSIGRPRSEKLKRRSTWGQLSSDHV